MRLTLKSGHRVRCVGATDGLVLGSVYTVAGLNALAWPFTFRLEGLPHLNFGTDRFVDADDEQETVPAVQLAAPEQIDLVAHCPALGTGFVARVIQPTDFTRPRLRGDELQNFVDRIYQGAPDFLVHDHFAMLKAWEQMDIWRDKPTWPNMQEMMVGIHLLQEELGELALGLASFDFVKTLDALGDLDVVLTRMWIILGLHAMRRQVSSEILKSNLTKVDPATGRVAKTAAGRVIKGDHFVSPDLYAVLMSSFPLTEQAAA